MMCFVSTGRSPGTIVPTDTTFKNRSGHTLSRFLCGRTRSHPQHTIAIPARRQELISSPRNQNIPVAPPRLPGRVVGRGAHCTSVRYCESILGCPPHLSSEEGNSTRKSPEVPATKTARQANLTVRRVVAETSVCSFQKVHLAVWHQPASRLDGPSGSDFPRKAGPTRISR